MHAVGRTENNMKPCGADNDVDLIKIPPFCVCVCDSVVRINWDPVECCVFVPFFLPFLRLRILELFVK